jgi:hypothetical protein
MGPWELAQLNPPLTYHVTSRDLKLCFNFSLRFYPLFYFDSICFISICAL